MRKVPGNIRACLVAQSGAEGHALRIRYGASVKPNNAAAILALPDVDGALAGGASPQAGRFAAIIAAAH